MIALILALVVNTSPTFKRYDVTYVDCYDGDTCAFNFHLGLDSVTVNQQVRFCDVDAPEIRPLATRAKAVEVRDAVHELLVTAKKIVIFVPQKRGCALPQTGCDKRSFNRLLGYVVVDGVNLSFKLLDLQLATTHEKQCGMQRRP